MAADRARDFVARFLTDLSRFDADKAADQLDDVADASEGASRGLDDVSRDASRAQGELDSVSRNAEEAAREVDRLGSDAERAGRQLIDSGRDADRAAEDVERFGENAEDTARKLDDSLDRIRSASRSGFDDVGDAADRGGDKLREVGDEAGETAREMGASFTGSVDDIADAVQELGAQALAGLGPIGAAAGLAAAMGLGVLKTRLEESAEEANAVKDRVIELAQEIDEVGGSLDGVNLDEKIRAWSLEIADNKSWWEVWQRENLTRFEELEGAAAELGLSFDDLLRGMSGHDPAAAGRAWRELTDRLGEYDRQLQETASSDRALTEAGAASMQLLTQERDKYADLRGELERVSGVNAEALDLQERLADVMGASTAELQAQAEAQRAYSDTLASIVDPLGAYTSTLAEKQAAEQEAAQATADSTEKQSDSWEDYAEDVSVSVGEYLATLREQVTAQESWSENMRSLAGKVSDETLAELGRMGPEGAPLVAELVNASDSELRELDDLFGRRTSSATEAVARELAAGQAPAATRGRAIGAAAGSAMAAGFRDYSGDLYSEANRVLDRIQRDANGRQITVKVRLDTSGATSGLQTFVRGARVAV